MPNPIKLKNSAWPDDPRIIQMMTLEQTPKRKSILDSFLDFVFGDKDPEERDFQPGYPKKPVVEK